MATIHSGHDAVPSLSHHSCQTFFPLIQRPWQEIHRCLKFKRLYRLRQWRFVHLFTTRSRSTSIRRKHKKDDQLPGCVSNLQFVQWQAQINTSGLHFESRQSVLFYFALFSPIARPTNFNVRQLIFSSNPSAETKWLLTIKLPHRL